MSNYVKKKLPYFQVHRVISVTKQEGRCAMRQLTRPYLIAGVPEGCFAAVEDGILLPKKRRGEKFLVVYTQMFEKEF